MGLGIWSEIFEGNHSLLSFQAICKMISSGDTGESFMKPFAMLKLGNKTLSQKVFAGGRR